MFYSYGTLKWHFLVFKFIHYHVNRISQNQEVLTPILELTEHFLTSGSGCSVLIWKLALSKYCNLMMWCGCPGGFEFLNPVCSQKASMSTFSSNCPRSKCALFWLCATTSSFRRHAPSREWAFKALGEIDFSSESPARVGSFISRLLSIEYFKWESSSVAIHCSTSDWAVPSTCSSILMSS